MAVRRFLIRYGKAGRIDWFGTIHQWPIDRRHEVVVQNAEGLWLGRVLAAPEPHPVGTEAEARGDLPQPRGEILRHAEPRDREAARRGEQRAAKLRELAQQALGPRQERLLVLESEVTLDAHSGVIHFLGRAEAALGPLAVTLAEQAGLARVQWLEHRQQTPRPGTPQLTVDADDGARRSDPPPHPAASPGSAAGNQPNQPDQPDQPDRSAENTGAPPRELARLLRQPASAGRRRLARRQRGPLGMLGVYWQKDRPPPAQPGTAGPAPPSTNTDWGRWMVRVKTAGGALTPGQFERLVALAEECGDGTLRLTMRQGLQLHGVRWGTVGELLERLETAALYSRGSCGNALRNVVCCPLAADDAAGRAARQLAAQLAQEFFPTADWLDYVIEQASDAADEAPAAGRPSESAPSHSSDSAPSFPVPHKWKIGVATATHNCVNVLSNDLALIVHIGDDRQVRLDCHVGGSTALRSGPRARSAALAQPLCQIPLAEAATLVRAIMRWHHLHGGRGPRPERRLKRVLGREGIASLRRFVYQALRTRLAGDWDAAAPPAYEVPWQLHEGWYHDSGGRATLVVPIPTGRLGIRPSEAHRPAAEHDRRQSAFRSRPESARAWLELTRHARWLRIAPGHSLVLGDVDAPQRGAVERWLREQLGWTSSHRAASPTRGGIQETPADSSATEQSPRLLVCVAHPSCPLAQGEAEGDYPVWEPWLALLAEPLGRLLGNGGWQRETAARAPLMALAGCENGCSHPLSVPLGLIARDRERLDVYLGGDGRRLGKRALQASEPQQLVAQLRWLADRFAPAASRDRRAAGTTERPLDYALAWLESEAGRLNFPWPLPADRLS